MTRMAKKFNGPTLSIKASKMFLLADIHFGKYSANEDWQETMRSYFYGFFIPLVKDYMKNHPEDICVLFVLGDVFDDRKNTEIKVNNLAVQVFLELGNILPVYIMSGNHDLKEKTHDGTSSLISLQYIPNVTLIREVSLVKCTYAAKKTRNILCIPYMDEFEKENMALNDNAAFADYAFMHTDIAKMKYSNGMTIKAGVNTDGFKGKIYSGHIHKRDRIKNVTYVGSPYHMDRSDIGNQKGVYILDLANDSDEFIENNFSPIYLSLEINEVLGMNEDYRKKLLSNNIVDFKISQDDEDQINKDNTIIKLAEEYNIKSVRQIVTNSDIKINNEEEAEELKEISIKEQIIKNINNLEYDEDRKQILIEKSNDYIKKAESKMVV